MQITKSTPLERNLKVLEECARRVQQEYRETQWAWKHFWAMNGYTEDERTDFILSINVLELGEPLNALKDNFAKETILGIFRLTDSNKDARNLYQIAKMLRDEEIRSILVSKSSEWPTPNPMDECSGTIDSIINSIPAKWSEHELDSNPIVKFREKFKPIRDAKLGHNLDINGVISPNDIEVDDALKFLALKIDQVNSCVLGASTTTEWDVRLLNDKCMELWDHFEKGVTSATKANQPTIGFASDEDQIR